MYLYVVQGVDGKIYNKYWDRKNTSAIEQVINMHSTRTPVEDKPGWSRSNRDAVILNIIEVENK